MFQILMECLPPKIGAYYKCTSGTERSTKIYKSDGQGCFLHYNTVTRACRI